MTATGHAVIGTVIAAKIGNPALAIPIALLSHIVADLFPHWDFGTHRKEKSRKRFFIEAIIDVLASIIVTFLLIYFIFPHTNGIYALLVVFFAQFLDWATSFYLFFNMKYPPFSWIYTISDATNITLDKPWGIINQILLLTFLLLFAKMF